MKKMIFTFIAVVALFISGQATVVHADRMNHIEQGSIKSKINPRKLHHIKNNSPKSDNNHQTNLNLTLSDWLEPGNASSIDEHNMIANLSPKMLLTSNKYFKVPETDTIDGDSETTDPSKGYAINHYTGDNVNGDAQANDYAHPKQGQKV